MNVCGAGANELLYWDANGRRMPTATDFRDTEWASWCVLAASIERCEREVSPVDASAPVLLLLQDVSIWMAGGWNLATQF